MSDYTTEQNLKWAVDEWHNCVANRPLRNVHRNGLDMAFRQMIRRFGGDDRFLCGPPHNELLQEAIKNGEVAVNE